MGEVAVAQEGILVSRRLVLKDSVTPDDIERLVETLHWQLAGYVKKDADRGVDFAATWQIDEAVEAHFTEDSYADERYFVVSGAELGRIEEALNNVQTKILIWSLDELILEVDGNIYPASKGKAVLRLGLGAPLKTVDSVKDRILGASKNPETRVRRRAVQAMAYTPWPEYWERLAEMAEGDPDETVAREAAFVMQALSESGGERS
ncbi:hypothetical protein [Streptomyces sp. NRRL F-4489]|uniref:hypothetical protein n=1 Tax=Streptomyces sp. NRRL F-4489 TaxID=1609095 RepID=UPI00131D8755|nr:hypothetical protein [Streptomyces sp. NRRL F-4489]